MQDWSKCPVVEKNPEILSGAWVFKGTRVPVYSLFENLESGASVTDYSSWFPGVSIGQIEVVLEYASNGLKSGQVA